MEIITVTFYYKNGKKESFKTTMDVDVISGYALHLNRTKKKNVERIEIATPFISFNF